MCQPAVKHIGGTKALPGWTRAGMDDHISSEHRNVGTSFHFPPPAYLTVIKLVGQQAIKPRLDELQMSGDGSQDADNKSSRLLPGPTPADAHLPTGCIALGHANQKSWQHSGPAGGSVPPAGRTQTESGAILPLCTR